MNQPVPQSWHGKRNFSRIFLPALRYSFPVFLGYMAIGIAFGLLLVDAGYPWWLSLVMGLFMYAGAGQYIGVGLFAAGAGLPEAALVQLVVNARHIAYGLSMVKRFNLAAPFKPYLIFSLTDETFALLSSLKDEGLESPAFRGGDTGENRSLFMFLVSLLDQFYWVFGSVIGAVAGTLIPFNMEGIGFALTSLFVVLMIEQILRAREDASAGALPVRSFPGSVFWTLPFVISAAVAVAAVVFLPSRIALLSAMIVSLVLVELIGGPGRPRKNGKVPCR
ncbi:MAG: AzlC family ABC transporter permease [Spirochaetaceae bacterium]|jgi:4-azaleucine resistance transporter AzlC|nr:AzlC family ABC transporter permease [Spirochaetaceae bacterium]